MKEKNNSSLTFKPAKDLIIIFSCVLLIIVIVLITFFSMPNNDYSFVQIKYQNVLLYDKNDNEKKTDISFPTTGYKEVTFTKADSHLYLKDGEEFIFDEPITFTLYADKSIQLKYEHIKCPDHTCSKLGRVYNPYTPIVCLPNNIQAMIITSSFPEYVN